ncbi:hypothetical protein QFZ21_000093 [Microbacterium sp. W4I20]|nr:hypothetical protein [Microbacterium sp. W4I20]
MSSIVQLIRSTSLADAPYAYDNDVPSTLMGVTVLGYDDQLVEIEAIAAVASGRS